MVIEAIVAGVAIGLILGPPVAYWSIRWQDAITRHQARCVACRARAVRHAKRKANRHA